LGDAARAAQCELCVELPEAVPGHWDRSRLEQVVTNLVSNAIRHAAPGRIDVSLGIQGARARLVVKDSGSGIATTDLQRIFERFERATSRHERGGLGLGLFIAREIVLAHGGSISASSTLGAGSTFSVELPIARTGRREAA